jgi:hypothetical protein
MPGGICANSAAPNEFARERAVRCAEVVVRAMGVRRTIFLGGVAKSHFPERTAEQLLALNAGDAFSVVWQSAYFYGVDSVLGGVSVSLRQDGTFAAAPASMVRSLAKPHAVGGAPDDGSFFPATNTNHFMFRMHVPRLGAVFDSQQSLRNTATIHAIPPVGSVYELDEPVRFERNRARSSRRSTVAGSLVLESCRVKLMELGNLKVEVRLLGETSTSARFAFTMLNESTEDRVTATWLVWPRPEEPIPGAEGVVEMDRGAVEFEATLPRDLFYRRRWLAVSLTRPFDTDAAQAVVFPPLS